MSDFTQIIKEKRPTISESSLKTYNSILRSLYKKVFGKINKNGSINLAEDFNNVKPVLEHLEGLEPNKRKTILSALVVITDKKEYRDLMLDDIKDYNKTISKQEKNEKQEESWIEKDTVKELLNNLEANAKLLYKKKVLSVSDLQEIQNYIIISLLGGIYIPPRRSKDYVDLKINNIDKEKDNFIDKNKFVFNSYKTAKTYGQQTVEIPKELKTILNKWIKVNPTDYLLFDSNKEKLSNVKLNQRLNKLFGKKVSVNQLRKTYLTTKYKNVIELNKDIDNTFTKMGSSRSQFTTYVKK